MPTTSCYEALRERLYEYETGCRVRVVDGRRQPEHQRIYGNGARSGYFAGTGTHGWPPYRLSEIVHHLRSNRHSIDAVELYEFPDEESVEVAVRGGLHESFCMPPFGRTHEELVARYRYFRKEGAWIVYIVWRNNEEGQDLAFASKRAALEAGLFPHLIASGEVWRDCRQGGSIADCAGSAEERIDALMTFALPWEDISYVSSEFIEADEKGALPQGNSCPPPQYECTSEWAPEEPEKARNHSFAHERVQHLLQPLSPFLRADRELASAWLHYDGTRWVSHHSNDVINELLEEIYDRWGWQIRDIQTVNGDRAGLRRALGSQVPAPNARFLPFTNVCIDLETKEIVPHSPEHGNRFCLPFAYEPRQGKPTKILAFLKDRLTYDESVQLYRAFIWHVLTGTSLKAFLQITGPGNTGKSVLTNLAIALIGAKNTVSCSLKRLEDASNRFEMHRLRHMRLAVFSESQAYSGPLEMLKAVTGGDRIPCERKNSNAVLDFVFGGGVILTGNAPVRSSDTSGAVINRRRSLILDKVVDAKDERLLLEFDGFGGLRGELVSELPGFVDYCLQMSPEEAKAAIARDVAASGRAEAEKQVLLSTDHLAAWANECLVFDDSLDQKGEAIWWQRVGTKSTPAEEGLLANYQGWISEREQTPAYGMRTFKGKLVDLLRDTLGLPLPKGDHQKGHYRRDGTGSVVPFVRFRRSAEEQRQGVVDAAFAKRVAPIDQRVANGENPVSNGTNGTNGLSQLSSSCGSETAVDASQEHVECSTSSSSASTHQNRLFSWPKGSEPSQTVGNPFGSAHDVEK